MRGMRRNGTGGELADGDVTREPRNTRGRAAGAAGWARSWEIDPMSDEPNDEAPPNDEELLERLDDWARVLERAPEFLAKGQYSRNYEATFRTAAEIRDVARRLRGRPARARS